MTDHKPVQTSDLQRAREARAAYARTLAATDADGISTNSAEAFGRSTQADQYGRLLVMAIITEAEYAAVKSAAGDQWYYVGD